MLRHDNGFTLIELVVVIIILGVLSVIAAPKFISLNKDAKVAVLEGARGALSTANSFSYSKAALQGQELVDASSANIDMDSDGTADLIGYYGLIKFVISAKEYAGLDEDLTISKHYGGSGPTLPYFLISFTDNPASAVTQCFLSVYYPDTAGGSVTYEFVTEDC
ncbi:type II secretion system protein [Shewanella woodyi]|uniref:Putative V10 pilin n=1 Tax=Shewanella woodyi (strain ATCC 51908 / MS32) TaxID=392500 RepID=B1KER6_SHEWM|nr:type II secretion system protein [Shewanella woodyi]ACA88081.1 putative V10 pilin [Shewanella woodyi ATCC 51908]